MWGARITIPQLVYYYLDYLYKADRGAHTYWLSKGTVDLRPDHILNLIHYEVNTPASTPLYFYLAIVCYG